MPTSALPDPSIVLSKTGTTPQPSVLLQKDSEHERLLKFLIGLRLLGEQKKVRFLAYMTALLEQGTPCSKEGE